MKKLFKKKLFFFILPLTGSLVGYLFFSCFFSGKIGKKACFFQLKNKFFVQTDPQQFIQPNNRKIASYTLYTAEIEARVKKMMEEARRLHTIKDYKTANKILTTLLNQYSYASNYIEEAGYLLAKGLFYTGEFQRSEQVINRLREYDSHSKWFGYALLIKGKIYEQNGELDESLRLYRQVITDFSDTSLVSLAEDFLNDISF